MTPSALASTLPPLGREEAEHSAALEALIRRRIGESGGWIDFETFMDLALYAPGLGYYRAGGAKLGDGGDFTTAPEMSDRYSRCIARQCAEILDAVGGDIVEFGAGSGRMAAAVLEELARLGALPERYAILEVSADLLDRQRKCVARLPQPLRDRVVWPDRWPTEPIRGVILANEVLDALPCQRFALRRGRIQALGIEAAPDGGLREAERPADANLAAACEAALRDLPQPLPEGYVSEVNLRVEPWIRGVAEGLQRGVALLVDYGLPRAQYYHPDRSRGTLRCHFKQRAHDDPLIRVGVQDITAWVDFTRVAEAAIGAGLDVLGFATQTAFLLGTGITTLLAQSQAPLERIQTAGEVGRLLLPGEMGEAFKVMALGRDCERPLVGFAYQDLRASL
jgi:SAM-dependent MidA family methyltransferase